MPPRKGPESRDLRRDIPPQSTSSSSHHPERDMTGSPLMPPATQTEAMQAAMRAAASTFGPVSGRTIYNSPESSVVKPSGASDETSTSRWPKADLLKTRGRTIYNSGDRDTSTHGSNPKIDDDCDDDSSSDDGSPEKDYPPQSERVHLGREKDPVVSHPPQDTHYSERFLEPLDWQQSTSRDVEVFVEGVKKELLGFKNKYRNKSDQEIEEIQKKANKALGDALANQTKELWDKFKVLDESIMVPDPEYQLDRVLKYHEASYKLRQRTQEIERQREKEPLSLPPKKAMELLQEEKRKLQEQLDEERGDRGLKQRMTRVIRPRARGIEIGDPHITNDRLSIIDPKHVEEYPDLPKYVNMFQNFNMSAINISGIIRDVENCHPPDGIEVQVKEGFRTMVSYDEHLGQTTALDAVSAFGRIKFCIDHLCKSSTSDVPPAITEFQKRLKHLEVIDLIDRKLIGVSPDLKVMSGAAPMERLSSVAIAKRDYYHNKENKTEEDKQLYEQFRVLHRMVNCLIVNRGKHSGASHHLTWLSNQLKDAIGVHPLSIVADIKNHINDNISEGNRGEHIKDLYKKIVEVLEQAKRILQNTSEDQPGPSSSQS